MKHYDLQNLDEILAAPLGSIATVDAGQYGVLTVLSQYGFTCFEMCGRLWKVRRDCW
jgi:hypothetical protein